MNIGTIRIARYQPGIKYAITKKIHGQFVQLWRLCVQEFVLELVKHIAVDTGMSVASIQPLAARVNLRTALIESLKGKGPRRGHKKITHPGYQDNIASFKSASLGASLGKRAYTLNFGSPNVPELNFSFKIVVFQYFLHESSANWIRGKNWQSLEKAKEAFRRCWHKNMKKYVRIDLIANWLLEGKVS